MRPLRYRNGNQCLHRMSDHYRDQVRRKIHAYHVFMQAGAVAHGLLQYLATEFSRSGLGLVRLLAQNHSSRYSAIRVRR
jgi:hypothetical protein